MDVPGEARYAAALREIRALHQQIVVDCAGCRMSGPFGSCLAEPTCVPVLGGCEVCGGEWPCRTVALIDAALGHDSSDER